MPFSSEALKVGLVPPDNLSDSELRDWINKNCDPDKMGFDGTESDPDSNGD